MVDAAARRRDRGYPLALSDDAAGILGSGQFSQRPGAAPQQGVSAGFRKALIGLAQRERARLWRALRRTAGAHEAAASGWPAGSRKKIAVSSAPTLAPKPPQRALHIVSLR